MSRFNKGDKVVCVHPISQNGNSEHYMRLGEIGLVIEDGSTMPFVKREDGNEVVMYEEELDFYIPNIKSYSIEFKHENDKLSVSSTNEGYNVLELIGLFQWKIEDLIQQSRGIITPDHVKRTIIDKN